MPLSRARDRIATLRQDYDAIEQALLRCGVRLFEYPHTLLHQNVMTIDGVWSAVGSSNFDDRSFETNDAITLGILDEATARRLDAVFEKYAPHCREIELASWRMRGLGHRLKDNAYYLLNAQMPTTSEPSAFATCARIGLEHSTRALASVFKPMREIKR